MLHCLGGWPIDEKIGQAVQRAKKQAARVTPTEQRRPAGRQGKQRKQPHKKENLHKVALEEVLQLPLGCRVGQVADVEAATLGSGSEDGIAGLVFDLDRSIVQRGGNVGDGGIRALVLHGGRHVDEVWIRWRRPCVLG